MFRKNILFAVIAFIFLSCGIDDVVYLEPPIFSHSPTGHNDENEKYFEFETSDSANLTGSAGYFKGFEVYYRIYESERDCRNLVDNIINYNKSNPSNAVSYLLSSYNFKLLTYQGHSYQDCPLVPAGNSSLNRRIKFRLEAVLSLPNDFLIDGTSKGRVLRQNSEEFSSAKKGDYDVQSSSNSSAGSFYVAAFAAAYGFDKNFRPIYSSLVSLGYVEIKKNTLISP